MDNIKGFYSLQKNIIPEKSRVLVTGACGSVGSALVRRLYKEGHTVCAFDQSEDGLFNLDQEFNDGNDRLKLFVGNVRDEERLRRAMDGVIIVFHCAALKHVYISEYNPFETLQTNILGTDNVIRSALSSKVDRVIITSSDKAVNPTSTMGATKLIGERLFISANHFAGKNKTKFSCVRFGNVLNSNGSVLKIFKRQFSNNLPFSITSRNMTRFFLSMSQAVDLCIGAVKCMEGGEIFVMNMGSCNIINLAKALTGSNALKIKEIGLKPGEKLYEELVTSDEAPRTVIAGNVYIILPSTFDMMPFDIRNNYCKYNSLPRLKEPLRSDHSQLSQKEIISLLRNAGITEYRLSKQAIKSHI